MKVFHNTCSDSNAVGKDLLIKATGCIHKHFNARALRPATLRDDQITGFGGRSPVHISQAVALTVFTNPKEVPCATRPITFPISARCFPSAAFCPVIVETRGHTITDEMSFNCFLAVQIPKGKEQVILASPSGYRPRCSGCTVNR